MQVFQKIDLLFFNLVSEYSIPFEYFFLVNSDLTHEHQYSTF